MKKHGVRIGLLGVMLVMIAALLCGCASQKASASGKQDDRLVGKWCAEEIIPMYYNKGIRIVDALDRYGSSYAIQQIEFFDNGKFVAWGRNYDGGYTTMQGDYAICDNYTVILNGAFGSEALHFNVSGEALSLWGYGAQARKEIIGDKDIEIVQYIKQ